MTAMAATFRSEADEAFFAGYWLALDDLPIGSIERGVRRALRECKFLPSGAELRELCGVMPPSARAVSAWDAFQRAVSLHGYYRSVTFDDPLINATVRSLGGWQRVCCLTGDEFDVFLRREFERVYVSLMSSGVSEEQALPLLGHVEEASAGQGEPERYEVATGLPPHRQGVVRPAIGKAAPPKQLAAALATIGTDKEQRG